MMEMTTNNSISVKPEESLDRKRESDFIVECRLIAEVRLPAATVPFVVVIGRPCNEVLALHIVCHGPSITHNLLSKSNLLRQLRRTFGAESF